MKKKIYILVIICVTMLGCKTTINSLSADYNIRRIELGMTKEKVISIMGDVYKVVGAESSPDGKIEAIGYFDHVSGMYRLYIQNGILIKWEYDPGSRSVVENRMN